MKRFLCLFLLCCVAIGMIACGNNDNTTTTTTTTEPTTSTTVKPAPDVEDTTTKGEGVMTWNEYMDAALESEVVIEAYVQAKQAWWFDNTVSHGKGTFYLQDGIGGYFLQRINELADSIQQNLADINKLTNQIIQETKDARIADSSFVFREAATSVVDSQQQLANTLDKLNRTLDSLKALSDSLGDDPSSLLRGKQKTQSPGE